MGKINYPRVGFAGMTHLGLVSAMALCSKGFPVFCYDEREELIKQIKTGVLPVSEPRLEELIQINHNQTFSSDLSILSHCDVVYVASDVSTDNKGQSHLSEIRSLVEKVSRNLSEKAILVILCQVPPGFTREIYFTKERLYYQVETLVFGHAVERSLHPERFIVGCEHENLPLPQPFEVVLNSFGCPILKMNCESAELCKIAINLFLVASISVANTMSEICEKIGANWQSIVSALRLDKRIGKEAYLNPGLGISGGNLERDLTTLVQLSEKNHTNAKVIQSFVADSQFRKKWVYRILKEAVLDQKKNPIISILGLTYKENTHSLKNSPSLALLEDLKSHQVQVHIHDPVASIEMPSFVRGFNNLLDAIRGADALLLMTPWSTYREIKSDEISQLMKGKVVIDPYQILKGEGLERFDYYCLGKKALLKREKVS